MEKPTEVERARSWLESRGAGPRPLPPDYIVYAAGLRADVELRMRKRKTLKDLKRIEVLCRDLI